MSEIVETYIVFCEGFKIDQVAKWILLSNGAPRPPISNLKWISDITCYLIIFI